MKKILLLIFLGALFIGVNAQFEQGASSTAWSTTGNNIMLASQFFGTTSGNSIIFKTDNIERMRLLGDKPFLGIGLSNPTTPLHVHYQRDDPFQVASESAIMRLTTSETGFNNGHGGYGGFSIFSDVTKHIVFSQHEHARFIIQGPGGGLMIAPDGNIGMGTDIPRQKLHIVDGNILISRTSNKAPGSDNGSLFFGADVTPTLNGKWGIEYLNSDDPLYGGYGLNFWKPWYPAGGGEFNYALFLADNGNVGIGKNNPQAKLDVNGSFKAQSAEITGTLSANTLSVQNLNLGDTVSFKELNANNVNVKNRVSAYNLRASSSAVIDGYVTTTNLYTTDADVSNRVTTVKLYATNTEVSGYLTTKDLYVRDGATFSGSLQAKNMRIDETLCVNEIRVMSDPCWPFPDYVFAKDYNLMPLSEVEQFIAENQHLPRVPSAAEVEANGMNLGEMNIILLEKVEELTLYIIQLEKRLSEVEKKKGGE